MDVFFQIIYTTWKYPNIHFLKSDVAISLPELPTMDPPIRSKAYLDRSKRSAPDVNWLSVHKYDIYHEIRIIGIAANVLIQFDASEN